MGMRVAAAPVIQPASSPRVPPVALLPAPGLKRGAPEQGLEEESPDPRVGSQALRSLSCWAPGSERPGDGRGGAGRGGAVDRGGARGGAYGDGTGL